MSPQRRFSHVVDIFPGIIILLLCTENDWNHRSSNRRVYEGRRFGKFVLFLILYIYVQYDSQQKKIKFDGFFLGNHTVYILYMYI